MNLSWRDTQLYKTLLKGEEPLESEKLITNLDKEMEKIQAWLDGEANVDIPKDIFTLYDSERAFRVAARMKEIIDLPSPTKAKQPDLSKHELALLLLVAYLLDICLTFKLGKVNLHHQYLLTGNQASQLSKKEIEEFEKWLNDEGGGVEIPLSADKLDAKIKRQADKLITYYCRERRKRWSESWIREHLSGCHLYNDITDNDWSTEDLVQLCCSAFQTYQELLSNSEALETINRKTAAYKDVTIQKGYLAAVVRAANILEFDPMHVPDVILHDYSTSSSQLIKWWDANYQQTNLTINDTLEVELDIHPTKALIHRAIITVGDEIDKALAECQRLAFEKKFSDIWFLQPSIRRRIIPKNKAYEYIDGSFRPNTEKILELLSGTTLYGNPLVAVREMLQNAFDAVREEIAYKRLRDDNNEQLNSLHHVTLEIQLEADDIWLVCIDNGVGMTKAIIQNYLLVSGSTRRHGIINLERQCKAKGFSLGRTGQFGIGVLSYFMLADRVVIKTRRSPEPGDEYTDVGWRFETEGIGTFGELKKCKKFSHGTHGTEIRLHLKPNICDKGISNFFLQLRDYLKETLVYIPCKFILKSNLPKLQNFELQEGWVSKKEEFCELAIESLEPSFNHSGYSSRPSFTRKNKGILEIQQEEQARQIELDKRKQNYLERIKHESREKIDWEVWEEELKDGEEILGKCRIHLPFFRLADLERLNGVSLSFMHVYKKTEDRLMVDMLNTNASIHAEINGIRNNTKRGCISIPNGFIRTSWKGMKIDNKIDFLGAFIEIDWNSSRAGELSVTRNHMTGSQEAIRAFFRLREKFHDLRLNFLQKHEDKSSFALLNYFITTDRCTSKTKTSWLVEQQEQYTWEPLIFPCHLSGPTGKNIYFQDEIANKLVPSIPMFKGVTYSSGDYDYSRESTLLGVSRETLKEAIHLSIDTQDTSFFVTEKDFWGWDLNSYPPSHIAAIYYEATYLEKESEIHSEREVTINQKSKKELETARANRNLGRPTKT